MSVVKVTRSDGNVVRVIRAAANVVVNRVARAVVVERGEKPAITVTRVQPTIQVQPRTPTLQITRAEKIVSIARDGAPGVTGAPGPPGSQGPEGPQGDRGIGIVNHGDDPNFPRPDDPNPLVWEGTVMPNNWLEEDIWINPEAASTPIYAQSIAIQDPNDAFISTTVEEALAELALRGGSGSGSVSGVGYQHVQNTPSTVWTVQHNLGFHPGGITVYDSDNELTFGWTATYSSINVLILIFTEPLSGTVYVS